MQLQITNIRSVRRGVPLSHLWNITVHIIINTVMKQCKVLKGNLKPEYKKKQKKKKKKKKKKKNSNKKQWPRRKPWTNLYKSTSRHMTYSIEGLITIVATSCSLTLMMKRCLNVACLLGGIWIFAFNYWLRTVINYKWGMMKFSEKKWTVCIYFNMIFLLTKCNVYQAFNSVKLDSACCVHASISIQKIASH